MEVRVGQWARRNDDRIFQIFPTYCLTNSDWKSKEFGYDDTIIKVADTPKELVQEGDLVEWNNQTFKIGNGHLEVTLSRLRVFDNITAIYTPNEDKTVFTEQWRVK